jgi:PKD repeat protein
VAPVPVIDAPACTARVCTFSATASSDPDGDTFTYLWNFGDGSTSTGAAPTHPFATDNTYTITLTLTDTWGKFASTTRTVTIAEPATNVPPVPVINPVVCVIRACTIYGSSSYEPNSDTFTYLWTFGSGTTTSTAVSPSFTYPADGTYTITLTVTDAWGRSASTTRLQTIGEPAGNLPPVPVINAPTCVAVVCNFSSVGSADPNGDPFTAAWNWGDGTANGTTANMSHQFTGAGTFTVTLTLTDGWGRSASTTRPVTFVEPATNAAPVPVIGVPTCVARVCTFSGVGSADPNGDGFTYTWNWGDGTVNGTGVNPAAHTFAAAGTFTVTLTVTDWWGDAASTTRQVTVT